MKGTIAYFESSYNKPQSDDVKIVNEVNDHDVSKHGNAPTKGKPNSVTRIYREGRLIRERYYDENGDVYLDIDYTNHGNPKTHPVVPHQHRWNKDEKGNPQRDKKWEEIKHDNMPVDRVGEIGARA